MEEGRISFIHELQLLLNKSRSLTDLELSYGHCEIIEKTEITEEEKEHIIAEEKNYYKLFYASDKELKGINADEYVLISNKNKKVTVNIEADSLASIIQDVWSVVYRQFV